LGIFYLEIHHHGASAHNDISYKALEYYVAF
jgi:hypothetical protein